MFQLQWGGREKTEEEVDDIWTHLNRGSDGLRGDGQKDRVASLDAWPLCQSLKGRGG